MSMLVVVVMLVVQVGRSYYDVSGKNIIVDCNIIFSSSVDPPTKMNHEKCYYRVTLLKPCETHATSPSSALQCFAAEELQIFFIFLSFKNVTLCGTLSTTFYTLWKKCLIVLTNRHTIDTVLVKCENTYLPLEITDLATCSFFISSDLPAPTPVSQ